MMFRKTRKTLSPHTAKFHSKLSHANNIYLTLIRCDVHNYMHFTRLSVVTVQSTVKLRPWCIMYGMHERVAHIRIVKWRAHIETNAHIKIV